MTKKTHRRSNLDRLRVSSPCSVSWDSMIGNERERNCSGCSKRVFNISDMTKREAELFLDQNKSRECITLYRRADGTIMTDDCPRALRKLRDQFKFVAKVAVGLIAAIVSLPAAIAESVPSSRFTEKIKVRKLVKPPSILSGTVPADLESRKGSFKTVELLFPGSLGELLNPAGVSRQGTQQILQATGNIDPGAFSEELISGVSDEWWFLPNPGKDEIEPEHENNADLDLPNSLKLDFVDSTIDDRSKTEFLDTRASDLYSKAQAAKADRNLNLYESLLVETLEVFDKQKNGDPAYRKIIETELRNFRKLNDDHRSETDEK